jgi:hypothetical protein
MRGSVSNIQTMATPAPRQDSSTDYILPADAFVMFTTPLWNALRQQQKQKENKTKIKTKQNIKTTKTITVFWNRC